jgi:hypothetical protein
MKASAKTTAPGGLAGWLLARFKTGGCARPKLELLERITLAPRQSLALVEAEGRRFLVATSAEGAPAFFALDERARSSVNGVARVSGMARSDARAAARVSW